MQALAKHIEQLVALPDELRQTTIRRFKRLCDSCGCHNERELAACLAEERQPRACPLACFLRIGGQLAVQIKLPACISLAVAGRDVSWYALRVQLQAAATAVGASDQLQADVAIVTQSWPAIRRRFRSKGVRGPRQLIMLLILDPHGSPVVWLVPYSLSRSSSWLEPLRRALRVGSVDVRKLFPRLQRGEGAPRTAEHQALLHEVLRGLRDPDVWVSLLLADKAACHTVGGWRRTTPAGRMNSLVHGWCHAGSGPAPSRERSCTG